MTSMESEKARETVMREGDYRVSVRVWEATNLVSK